VDPAATYDLRASIITAFGMARAKGRPDWRKMSAAVLKNRLLLVTKKAFDERLHNVTSFRELLAQQADLVRFVEADGMWELLPSNEPTVGVLETAPDKGTRIRPDLWKAVMDFSSGHRYVWDAKEQCAAVAGEDQVDANFLPTMTREEFAGWRNEFAKEQPPSETLQRWCVDFRSRELPLVLVGQWNGFVKSHVASRLENWFREHELQVPQVFVVRASTLPPESHGDDSASILRDLLHACINVMTAAELEDLRLSPAVIVRSNQWRRR
jgi:hypothetical protein